LPAEEVPPEAPEPTLGINFARDGMRVRRPRGAAPARHRYPAAAPTAAHVRMACRAEAGLARADRGALGHVAAVRHLLQGRALRARPAVSAPRGIRGWGDGQKRVGAHAPRPLAAQVGTVPAHQPDAHLLRDHLGQGAAGGRGDSGQEAFGPRRGPQEAPGAQPAPPLRPAPCGQAAVRGLIPAGPSPLPQDNGYDDEEDEDDEGSDMCPGCSKEYR
jgi:hypothetical protein